MNAVDEIKAAAAKLHPDQQFELFRWWIDSDAFRGRQLAALKSDIAGGIEQLETGRFHDYDDTNVMRLAEDVGRCGRERLAREPKDSEV